MTGIMCLYITGNCNVHKIPIPNGKTYKCVPALANEEVLFTLLYYETIDRKPSKLITANFDRFQLDNNGGYELTFDEVKKRSYNFEHYNFFTTDTLSPNDCIQIPQATILPTDKEKETLYNYVKEKFPSLWYSFPEVLEHYIENCKYIELQAGIEVGEFKILFERLDKKLINEELEKLACSGTSK